MNAMKITKTITVEVPGLGAKIKYHRERDPRSLIKICQAMGMTSANWYRIEKEDQSLPIETLRKIEAVLGVDLGVNID